MKVVGLTGGIGSGKSTVAKILGELGAYIIDADELARRIVEPGKPAWKDLQATFGAEFFHPDGTLNRKKLAEKIFANPEERKKLELITHPRVGEEIMRELARAKSEARAVAVIDAALLVESPAGAWIRPLILVVADEDIRVQRVCGRDGTCKDDVLSRIRNQASDEARRKKADFIIENNRDLDSLRPKVVDVFRKLLSGDSGISGK